jgi:hypothetical protein
VLAGARGCVAGVLVRTALLVTGAGSMTLSWLPDTTQGRAVGDYISTSFNLGGAAFYAFAVASAPTSGGSDCHTAIPSCNEAIFTNRGGLGAASASPATDQTSTGASATRTSNSLTDQ